VNYNLNWISYFNIMIDILKINITYYYKIENDSNTNNYSNFII